MQDWTADVSASTHVCDDHKHCEKIGIRQEVHISPIRHCPTCPRYRHLSRRHCGISGNSLNGRRDLRPDSARRLRLVCLDTIASISTGKWRHIDSRDTVGVDVAALLTTRSSRTRFAHWHPGPLWRLIVPFCIYCFQHRATIISHRTKFCIIRLFYESASLRPMMRPISKSDNCS